MQIPVAVVGRMAAAAAAAGAGTAGAAGAAEAEEGDAAKPTGAATEVVAGNPHRVSSSDPHTPHTRGASTRGASSPPLSPYALAQ